MKPENTAPATGNSARLEINNSAAQNVAQMVGSDGSSISQSSVSNDLKGVCDAIDHLVAAVKSSPAVSPDAKADSQIEADQLKGEIKKSKPNPSRIKEALDWFKTAAGVAGALPKLMDLGERLKTHFPTVL